MSTSDFADQDLLRLKPLAQALEQLFIFGERAHPNDLAFLRGSPSLEKLHRSHMASDFDFDVFATCPKLKKLTLGAYRLDESQFDRIAQCSKLNQIRISFSDVTGSGLVRLNELPELETLTFANMKPACVSTNHESKALAIRLTAPPYGSTCSDELMNQCQAWMDANLPGVSASFIFH